MAMYRQKEPSMIRFAALFLAFAFAAVAQAQQFKWVDKDGKVRYGDTPPPGVKATPMKAPAGPTPPAPAAASGKDAKKGPPLTPDEAFRKRQEEQKKAAEKSSKAEKEAADLKQNCEQARETLRNLESGQRIARTDDKGERYFVDDNQRAAELARAQQSVSQWCK
jgi:Domain of unknown function (DUF4124)